MKVLKTVRGLLKSILLAKDATRDPQIVNNISCKFQSGLDMSISHGDKFSVSSLWMSIGSGVRLSMVVLFVTVGFSSDEVCSAGFGLSSSFVSVDKRFLN